MINQTESSNKAIVDGQYYKLLLQNLPGAAVFVFDKDLRYTVAEGPILASFGYTPDQLIGKTLDEILSNRSVEFLRPRYLAALEGIESDFEQEFGGLNFRARIAPVRNECGEIIAGMILSQDITAQKRAELEHELAEARYRFLAEMNPEFILQVNTNREFVYVSPTSVSIVGYTPEEMLGHTYREFLHPDDAATIGAKPMDKALQIASNQPKAYRFRHKAGHYLWVEYLGRPVFSEGDGTVTGIVFSIRDVTARKEAEAALEQALAKEKALNELKSRFVSMASHEYRTPLTTILMVADTLLLYRSRMTDEQMNDRLEKIRRQVSHLTTVTEDVLELSRMQSGRRDFSPTLGDLHALCGDVVEEFSGQDQYAGRLIYSATELPIHADFDERLIRQILTNLISNALKYSPDDKSVQVELVRHDDLLALSVSDHGIGIPDDDQSQIFDPFHRGENVGAISGTGLGLSITKQAVDLHHGTITLNSRVGNGTTVTVTIPRRQWRDQRHDNSDNRPALTTT